MAAWITKPWIENALKSTSADTLPKIARAQVLKIEEASNGELTAIISDKKLFVRARLSTNAIAEFNRDNTGLSMREIQGGLIFIKKYTVEATTENELDEAEFIINVNQFKFAGGEGNTPFGSDLLDSSSLPHLQARLHSLWTAGQLRAQMDAALKSHNQVYIPDIMERKLTEIPEWKPSYCPPQTSEMQSSYSYIQEQICAESAENIDRAEHEAQQKEVEKESCPSQEYRGNILVSSSYVSSSQKSVVLDQPLKGLTPEEPCSSSSETSQLRESSEESYSILKGKTPEVNIVHSSQNSNEFEIEQPLPHVTPECSPFNCSLTESQLGRLLETSVSCDDVTSPSVVLDVRSTANEGFTRIKPRDAHQVESLSCNNTPENRQSTSEASNTRNATVTPVQLCSVPSHDLKEKEKHENRLNERVMPCKENASENVEKNVVSPKTRNATPVSKVCSAPSHDLKEKEKHENQINERVMPSEQNVSKDVDKDVVVTFPPRGSFINSLDKKEELENTNVDFDGLFEKTTWNHPRSQTLTEDFSADLFEIDRRQSIKRKRSEKDDTSQKARVPGGERQNRLVSPDSTCGSQSQSLSPPNNHSSSMVRLEDLYSQQELFLIDTESQRSPDEHSPSILQGNSMEQPCTLSTPTFGSLPSYQVPQNASDKGTPLHTTLPSPMEREKKVEKREAECKPETSGDAAPKAMKPPRSKKTKARKRFNWFSDAY